MWYPVHGFFHYLTFSQGTLEKWIEYSTLSDYYLVWIALKCYTWTISTCGLSNHFLNSMCLSLKSNIKHLKPRATGCLILLHPPNFLLEMKVIMKVESNPWYPRIYEAFEQEWGKKI